LKWLDKLQTIDRRIIYLVLFIALATPLLRPIGIPLAVDSKTRAIYDIIEGLDPQRDVVMLSLDYDPAGIAELHPQAIAVVTHLANRGIKWVGVTFVPDGPMMMERVALFLEGKGLKYGVDFATLGYMPGGENAIRLFALDALSIPVDMRGNKTSDLPIMRGISSAKDFALVFQISGFQLYESYIRQVVDPMNVRYVLGLVTVSVPIATPFVNSGQIKGLLPGLRGAAEYEILIGVPGSAASMMDAQSMGHLVMIGFVLLGNVAYVLSKKIK
jgi:hypothetical protein